MAALAVAVSCAALLSAPNSASAELVDPPRQEAAPEPIVLEPTEGPPLQEPGIEPGGDPDAQLSPPGDASESAPQVPAPQVAGEVVRVAVGLSADAPGTRAEVAVLDALEQSARASSSPPTQVRRLRAGAGRSSEICREGREDLVITVGYLPDREAPVLMSRDCRLDLELGVRASDAAGSPAIVGALWEEHRQLVAAGARERRVGRISPRTRTILIAGGASVLIGVAVGFLVASVLRDEEVVLTVSP